LRGGRRSDHHGGAHYDGGAHDHCRTYDNGRACR